MVVKEWQVRLYKRSMPTGGKDHWGSIIGKTAEEVMEKLKRSQDFEESFARWQGNGSYHEIYTYFNALGPIAVIAETNATKYRTTKYKRYFEEIIDHYNVIIKPNQEIFSKVREILGKKNINNSSLNNPFRNVGNVMKDYIESMVFANKQMAILHKKLTITNLSEQSLKEDIDKIYYEGSRKVTMASYRLSPLFKEFLATQTEDSGGEKDIEYYENRPNKPVKSVTYYNKGVKNGPEIEYFEDGRIKSKRVYKNGSSVGSSYIVDYFSTHRTIQVIHRNKTGEMDYSTSYTSMWKDFLTHIPVSHTMIKTTYSPTTVTGQSVSISSLPSDVLEALELSQ